MAHRKTNSAMRACLKQANKDAHPKPLKRSRVTDVAAVGGGYMVRGK